MGDWVGLAWRGGRGYGFVWLACVSENGLRLMCAPFTLNKKSFML